MSTNFYRAFEDKCRGSRELIKDRLKVYLPFVEILKQKYPHAGVVDLGCGRGEWLELLGEIGQSAHGVDLDDGMLEACRVLGLSHSKIDAITYIKQLPDESQSVVSGFHLAEHLPFSELQTLVQEAYRVLKPAGLLILETPNPENFSVGTTYFYLDPTHQRPIPPQLLAFLPEYCGYCRTKVLRLQESPDLVLNQSPPLLSLLDGVSPDYAIVSQKGATPESLEAFDEQFGRDYGLTIETLAMRYETNINQKFFQFFQVAQQLVEQTEAKFQISQQHGAGLKEENFGLKEENFGLKEENFELKKENFGLKELKERLKEENFGLKQENFGLKEEMQDACSYAAQLEAKLVESQTFAAQFKLQVTQLAAHTNWVDGELNAAKAKVDELYHSSHHWWTIAEGLDRELKSMINSRSWRYTNHLRVMGHMLRKWRAVFHSIPCAIKQGVKWLIKPILVRCILFVTARPALKAKILSRLNKYPALEVRLRRFSVAHRLGTGFNINSSPTTSDLPDICDQAALALTPRAKQIYCELKAVISKNKESC